MEGPDDRPYYLTPNDVADWCAPSLAWVASVLMVVISFYLYDVGFKCLVHPPQHLVSPETVTVLLSAFVRVDRSARWCVV